MARRVRKKQQRRVERERQERAVARKRQLRLVAVAAVVALLAAGIGYLLVNSPGGSSPGSLAPNFTLVDSNGNTFSLSQFRGKPVVLFFMTTSDWCLPCKVETRDHLRPLDDTYGSRIQVISIEMLPQDRSDTDLNAYGATYSTPWIYARDTATPRVSTLYGVTTLSTVIIVDLAGSIRFRQSDPPYSQMSDVLRSLGV